MLTIKQCPYTGPYSSSATRFPHSGPTVQALKRMVVRLELMSPPEGGMTKLTNEWPGGGKFDHAFRTWQLKNYLPADGVYGQQAWKVARGEKLPNGQHALDQFAQKLIKDEWVAANAPDEDDVRAAITEFCLKAEANEDAFHYRMARPLDISVSPDAGYVLLDCSTYVIAAYNYAARKYPALKVPDPSMHGYTGFGNTDDREDDHPKVLDGRYLVGDLAHYNGPTTHHVAICRRPGSAQTAVWSSHGQEAGPVPVSLHYRTGSYGLRFVVRPPLHA